MTSTVKTLQQMQLGKQTLFKTSVAPTAKLSLVQDGVEIAPEATIQEYNRMGSVAPSNDNEILAIRGAASVPSDGNYEDLPYWLDSMFDIATPSGADPYIYAYDPSLTAQPTRRISTLVYGDSTNAYGLVGAILDTLVISGESEGNWQIATEFVGAYTEVDAIAALADRAASIIRSADTIIYIDALGGTIGTTAIDCEAFSFSLELGSNTVLVPGLGSLEPCSETMLRYSGDLTLVMEFPGTSKTIVEAMLGLTPTLAKQLIRIEATSGTNIAQLDFAGSFSELPVIFTDRDSVTTLELSLRGQEDSGTFANWFKASITNDVITLP